MDAVSTVQHRAARTAGVAHVVKGSALGASDHSKSPIGKAHYEVEKVLEESSIPWTILRPHVFMQNFLDLARTIAREGRIRSASGEGKIPFIDARDIAAVAAVALTAPGHEGKKYVLTGPEALGYGDVARIIGKVVGRPVEYTAESLAKCALRDVDKDSGSPPRCDGLGHEDALVHVLVLYDRFTCLLPAHEAG